MAALYLLFGFLTVSYGSLTYKPKNVTALYGSTVDIPCQSNSTDQVHWLRTSRMHEFVFSRYVNISPSIKSKFNVERDENGFQNLTIKNVQYDDAEWYYTCIDDSNVNSRFRADTGKAHLNVMGSELTCFYNSTPDLSVTNLCGSEISSGPITIKCQIQYHGIDRDIFQWSAGSVDLTSTSIVKDDNLISSLTVNITDLVNGSVVTCKIKGFDILWSSPPITFVQYDHQQIVTNSCIPNILKCDAYSHLECDVRWTNRNGNVRLSRILNVESHDTDWLGEAQCTMMCKNPINNTECFVESNIVHLYACDDNTMAVILSVLVPLVAISIMAAVLCVLWYNRRGRRHNPVESAAHTLLSIFSQI